MSVQLQETYIFFMHILNFEFYEMACMKWQKINKLFFKQTFSFVFVQKEPLYMFKNGSLF